jgi:hypothetical protein
MNKLSLIFKWNQMSMQDLETFRNIKQQNEFGNFQKPSTEK